MMTVRETAKKLEVSPAMVYGLIASGRLRCYRMGSGKGVYRISDEHVADYLKSAEQGLVPPAPAEPVRIPRSPAKFKHLRF